MRRQIPTGIIGMVHLKALPGSPGFTGDIGAVESAPGWVHVDYFDHNGELEFIIMPMNEYKVCYPGELE